MAAIVVGYDGSACGEAALSAALTLAPPLGDEITVVFGYAPPGIWGGEIADHEEAIEELGERVLGGARRQASERGVKVLEELVPKRGVEALIEVADAREARMIVVGSFGESALKGIILGSTTNKLLHLTDRPVLVVPAEEKE
ncbi:MAG TPA: universal stress protein [Solirubrobacterales bacterium]|nr:universal stress protein [Solirubrobacterales bacterium]